MVNVNWFKLSAAVFIWAFIPRLLVLVGAEEEVSRRVCNVSPLGGGRDDTEHVMRAVNDCGHGGRVVFSQGIYNITKKMTWNLINSHVDLHGFLSFNPDIEYWLNPENTYRVVFIQNQASWFVITGHDFTVDAHNEGGIIGNGQPWWEYFQSHTRADGDGRPLSLTLSHVQRATVRNFHIDSPPFWCNTVADSVDVMYDGMKCNATNGNETFAGMNIVPNTDGINTYRSDRIKLFNWDVTCGDDCLAIKGNSTNIHARNVTCRGGNGIAVGSLGQYAELDDIVENVIFEDVTFFRLPRAVQPNMVRGVYFKTWTGTVNGSPPTGGGGGGGRVHNVLSKNVVLDRVDRPVHLYQTNGGRSGDSPSTLRFSNLSFVDWSGTATTNRLVDIECSAASPCPGISFSNFSVQLPMGQPAMFICQNVLGGGDNIGLPGPCNFTGTT